MSDTNEQSAKRVIPLENNPAVFSHLIHALGVSPDLEFHDIYTLEDVSAIPRPIYALILICPDELYQKTRAEEARAMEPYTGTGEHPVLWFRQTIREACGTMALLHAVCNGPARHCILPGSPLDKMRTAAIPLEPAARADVLYYSEELEKAHAAAAQLGDTSAPPLGESAVNEGHFICFVKGDDGHLWELNGGLPGPVDRGALEPEDDALSERALRLGVRTIIDSAGGNPLLSLVALGRKQLQ